MERRNERNRYYQGSYGDRMGYDNNSSDDYRRNDNFGRNNYAGEQDDRRWVKESREDFTERGVRNMNDNRLQNYRNSDNDMERNYRNNTRGQQGSLGDMRQGYGISSFEGSNDRYDSRMNDMQRNRNAMNDQGYGSGRQSGYSGSRFGGSNYSSNGDFGGSSDYGSMSGGNGSMDRYSSTSGYGGGYGNSTQRYGRDNSNYDRDNYGRSDRGGYYNDDRNR